MDTYVSQQKSQLLDSLENQVRFSQLVAVLVGDKGLGKTFLLDQLLIRISDEVLLARIDASMSMSEDQLAKTISLQLGLSWNDPKTPLEQKFKNSLEQKVLLMIDNAHLLSASCIEFILQLNQNQSSFQESVLFVLMAGENSLAEKINQSEIFAQHQDMCVVFPLEPIQLKESPALVAAFGHDNVDLVDGIYDEKKLAYFWQLSKGNPGEFNYHLSRWLEENQPSKIVEIKDTDKSSYLKSFFYVVIAACLMMALIFQDSLNAWIATGNPESKESTELTEPESKELESDQAIIPLATDQEQQKMLPNEGLQLENITQTPEPKRKTKNQNSAVARYQVHTEQKLSENNSSKHLIRSSNMNPNSQRMSEGKIKDLPTIGSAKKIVEPVIKKKRKTSSQLPASHEIKLTADERALINQDGNYFSLQWTGVSSFASAESFREQHLLKNKMKIYRRISNHKTLYLVVSDYFKNREEAELARKNYKQKMLKETPWIKTISAIQSEIKAFRHSKNSGG